MAAVMAAVLGMTIMSGSPADASDPTVQVRLDPRHEAGGAVRALP
jgi:hypothetical protein